MDDEMSSDKDYPSSETETESEPQSESEGESVDTSFEGPTEFCLMCGCSYEDKEEGCEFCHSKLDEVSSDEMDED
jgi:hypothetical protein